MVNIFNRKELITVLSDQRLYGLQQALSAAGIPFQVKSSIPPTNSGRYHGTPCINQDAAHPCIIYVKKSDYERARAAIQPVLRD
ncbi:MAG: hypothetical protein IKU72_00725 [Oscillospiraceae bacterium]|nr:hypothetical protein [Oscillospiraceae bacterium]